MKAFNKFDGYEDYPLMHEPQGSIFDGPFERPDDVVDVCEGCETYDCENCTRQIEKKV